MHTGEEGQWRDGMGASRAHQSGKKRNNHCVVRDAQLCWEGELCGTNEFEEWQGEGLFEVMEVGNLC